MSCVVSNIYIYICWFKAIVCECVCVFAVLSYTTCLELIIPKVSHRSPRSIFWYIWSVSFSDVGSLTVTLRNYINCLEYKCVLRRSIMIKKRIPTVQFAADLPICWAINGRRTE